MQEWQRQRSEKIADLVLGAHLLAYLLTLSVFIVRLPRSYSYPSLNAVLLGFFVPATVFIIIDYYLLSNFTSSRQKNMLLCWNITKHTVLFFLITYVLIFTQTTLQLQGALYLLPVVLAAISLGRVGGLIFSLAASLSLFMMTLEKTYFYIEISLEAAFLLSGIFLLMAWFLGSVIEVENNTSQQLANLVNEDELTGLGNHRLFQERLKFLVSSAAMDNKPLSLILLDIDNFKEYNDTYGHSQGDFILKELAALLQQNVPPGAELARYGSDEFSVILPGFSLEKAAGAADFLREIVSKHCFSAEGIHPYEELTVSAGVANLPYHACNREELLDAADEALYSSKVTGSNKVRVYLGVLEKIRHMAEDDDREVINSLCTLMTLVNAKDRYTYGHSERVAYYIREFAAYLELSEEFSRLLEYGAFLHDIGKLETPREILNKKGSLSEKERATMQEHPEWGAEILSPVRFLQPVVTMVLHHHENYNGTGYPSGLAGEEIPFAARILRIVDSYDAMKTVRPYHKPLTLGKIFLELQYGSNRLYDPKLVEAFIDMIRKKDMETAKSKVYLQVFK
ncbi:MAG: diguanylate cyclase [Dethiobacter sp.]|jgi:diguanylate cyclase (GGDEF)-like protein/putative nucleotidyltransferase with HDIG domain|nr:MAG: diguanylate cyclase [Dethiobacter sp.]